MSRVNNGLFSRADMKSVDMSGFTAGQNPNQNYWPMEGQPMAPTGVVEIDDSVQFPSQNPLPHGNHQHNHSHTAPINHHQHNHSHSSPVNHHQHNHSHSSPANHHHQHQSDGHSFPSHDHQHTHNHHYPDNPSSFPVAHQHTHNHQDTGRFSLPPINNHEHSHGGYQATHEPQSTHREHKHQHKILETFDPRWWYLPIDSVHAPKSWKAPEYHYIPPKWYESPRTYGKLLKQPHEHILPPRKHIDCRCLVCRPPREKTRGIQWVLNK
ncbi:unnamed protein product [Adineta steineri]|uniref:Uncharacterized protein n=1 Tax=Adineta steineri TaxID=433720 RepID=A0A813R495_9BILA|nr:unnamed protein product [Adineta steineri]